MIFTAKVEVIKLEERVSKKGNAYLTLKIQMPGNRYEYMNVMVDKDLKYDFNQAVSKVCNIELDYNTKFKTFLVVAVNS